MNFFHSFRSTASVLLIAGLSIPSSAEEQRQRAPNGSPSTSRPSAETKLDLNTAEVKALESEPVIGPDGARAIVAARPFATVDELDRIKGISAERLEQIRAKVTIATLHVPAKVGSPTVDTARRSSGEGEKHKVDINTADMNTLAAIPSIGPETARAIVAARPFTTIDDLSRVKGLSAERLEQIRTHAIVTPPERAAKKLPAP
jgi:competence protein ComEA